MNKSNIRINGDRIYLRNVELSDVNQAYVDWLNDPKVNQYLETRYDVQTMDSVHKFVEKMVVKKDELFFAICLIEKDKHIGNIKLGPVNWHHLYAYVSYFIGDKSAWGQGLATEAVLLVTCYGFESLGLNKCNAGVYSGNPSSIRVLEKVGYRQEGCLKEELLGPNGREDHLLYGLNKNFF